MPKAAGIEESDAASELNRLMFPPELEGLNPDLSAAREPDADIVARPCPSRHCCRWCSQPMLLPPALANLDCRLLPKPML